MTFPSKQEVDAIKEKYPIGTRIRLVHMSDEQAPPDGTLGTVNYVDDIGTIFCAWDTGGSLGLVVGIDEFEIEGKNN